MLGAPRVHVGALLRTDVLDTWGPPDKVLRDPAIGVPPADLAIDSFGQPLAELTRSLAGPPVMSGDALGPDRVPGRRRHDDWRHELPALGQLPAAALRDAVLQARQRIDVVHDR